MKCLYLIFLGIIPQYLISQWNTLVSTHILKLENGCDYTIKVAQMMPDTAYNYVPVGDMMSFRDQLIHLSENLVWLSTTYLSENKQDFPYKKELLRTTPPDEIRHIVAKSCQTAKEHIHQMDTTSMMKTFNWGKSGHLNKVQFLNLIQDHQTHHRGQLVVYLRLRGIKPPKYTGW